MWRRPLVTPAALMMVTGLTWLAGGLGSVLVFAHRGPLVHLLVGYPRNRLRDRAERVVVGFGYLDALVYPLGRLDIVTLALAASTVAVVARGQRRAHGSERRARLTSLVAATCQGAVLVLGSAARLGGLDLDHLVLITYEIVLLATSVALFVDARWGRWSRSAITGLVIDLGDPAQPTSLRDKLAAALGDPSLRVGYPASDGAGLVDETGRVFELPPPGPGRSVTTVRDGDRDIAVLLHDTTVLDDPALLDSVAALAKIALANAQLRADVLGTVTKIEESRRRLLVVADTERERLEAELRSGVQSRLARVATLLQDGPGQQELRDHLRICREAVADFARGVHPRALTDRGLSTALADLASTAPLPVELDVQPGRWTAEAEAAAYFVCAEALTNIARYASAKRARISLVSDGGAIHVEITDDGVGGADASAGSGLVGLADRLDVIGGTLHVDSPAGVGTRLRAAIPAVNR
jgi:signal transduction histidine kinase